MIARELELTDGGAFGELLRFAAIGAHVVQLMVRAARRGRAAATAASTLRRRRASTRHRRRVAVRGEDETAVVRPARRAFVLVLRKRQLLGTGSAARDRNEIEIRLTAVGFPVGRRDRIDAPFAVRAYRRRRRLIDVLGVEKGHRTLRLLRLLRVQRRCERESDHRSGQQILHLCLHRVRLSVRTRSRARRDLLRRTRACHKTSCAAARRSPRHR